MKYTVDYTTKLKKQYKKMQKQGKNLSELHKVIEKLFNGEELESKYKNHRLNDNQVFKDCYECHIMADWLLVYKMLNDELVLLLFATDSHSELFR